ncbi:MULTISPECIES: hypothetical protein [Cupriavidus]|uniref:Lipoprotein n=1 Tax=Cupriavidus pauculus TaxID=82633 RepID=A0A3G8H5P2_9BURK|nr:hypothetical protein [Cupriavidus pauculus]AZG15726.1 hypothetical protein EHF44_19890 [Cupriavidus pauculus]
MLKRTVRGLAALALMLTGCTVISVEGDHNRIRDAGGHGGVALPERDDGAATWLERLERIEKAMGIAHRDGQR